MTGLFYDLELTIQGKVEIFKQYKAKRYGTIGIYKSENRSWKVLG